MAKNTMTNRELPHAWAHGRYPNGQNNGGTLYYSGPTIYSYGSHFVIAHKVDNGANGPVVFVTDEKASVTTSKHVSFVRYAIPGYWSQFRVPELTDDMLREPAQIVDSCAVAIRDKIAVAAKTRAGTMKREDALETARGYIESARAVVEFLPRNKSDKKAARVALRKIPELPADDTTALQEFIDKAARAEFRATAKRHADEFAGHFDILRRYIDGSESDKPRGLDAFTPFSAWNMENKAERRLVDAHNALHRATRDAKKAKARNPITKATREEFATVRDRVAELAKQARAVFLVERAQDLRFSVIEQAVPQHAGSIGNALDFCRQYSAECEDLAALIPQLEPMHKAAQKRDAEKYAARCIESAKSAIESAFSYADSGHYSDAIRELKKAERERENARDAAKSNAFECPELPELPNADAWRAAIEQENAEKITRWRAGLIVSLPYSVGPLLRVNTKDGKPHEIETSHHARVPISAAPIMWRLICKARKESRNLEFRGKHIGHFDLRTVRADGSAVIGCHDITAAEFDAIAAQLGYGEVTA